MLLYYIFHKLSPYHILWAPPLIPKHGVLEERRYKIRQHSLHYNIGVWEYYCYRLSTIFILNIILIRISSSICSHYPIYVIPRRVPSLYNIVRFPRPLQNLTYQILVQLTTRLKIQSLRIIIIVACSKHIII